MTEVLAGIWLSVLACFGTAGAEERPQPAESTEGATVWPMSAPFARRGVSLNGTWRVIVDPFEAGRLDYQSRERQDGFGSERARRGPEDRVEHNWDDAHTLEVPGDWNSQWPELFFYEGTVWYRRTFEHTPRADARWFLRFEGANRVAQVWVNGARIGQNTVGFTPFEFEVTSRLREGENVVVVSVNNTRAAGAVPALMYDWWNYGGLTRDVTLLEVPATFVRSIDAQLSPDGSAIDVLVVVDPAPALGAPKEPVTVGIPELSLASDPLPPSEAGLVRWSVPVPEGMVRWSPGSPRLYEVVASVGSDTLRDRIGFRTIEAREGDIFLNEHRVFLKGICIHEEALDREGRAYSDADARGLLSRAKELGCNYVRLAHYPHSERMLRVADEFGLMVWAEIPVYWTLEYESPHTLGEAKQHLARMIARDRARASVIIWSIGNETGDAPERTAFRLELGRLVKTMDPSRLLSAALFARQIREGGKLVKLLVDDPFGELADVLAINEYVGWYHDQPEDILGVDVELKWNKPFLISETGADVKRGLRGEADEVWTEDFGVRYYSAQLAWAAALPELDGISPWILKDFRSPRRPLYGVQDWYNRKGLLDELGQPKLVFDLVRRAYAQWPVRAPESAASKLE